MGPTFLLDTSNTLPGWASHVLDRPHEILWLLQVHSHGKTHILQTKEMLHMGYLRYCLDTRLLVEHLVYSSSYVPALISSEKVVFVQHVQWLSWPMWSLWRCQTGQSKLGRNELWTCHLKKQCVSQHRSKTLWWTCCLPTWDTFSVDSSGVPRKNHPSPYGKKIIMLV